MQASVAAYIPWQKVVLALSAAGGLIARRSELEQIDERFFLGGRSSLRGFVESALLAEDACVAERPANASPDWTPPERPAGCNEQIQTPRGVAPLTTGGNAYLLGKAELRLPLTADFSLGLFVDAGNLWALPPDLSSFAALSNLRIRYGLGAGLRFNTPVGPLAFDIGFNPEPNEAQGERLYVPHFSVGVF
jgi:outer membrane protein assembly factor BamA